MTAFPITLTLTVPKEQQDADYHQYLAQLLDSCGELTRTLITLTLIALTLTLTPTHLHQQSITLTLLTVILPQHYLNPTVSSVTDKLQTQYDKSPTLTLNPNPNPGRR